eukprot:Protomagalhaensia_wolfi_Nauph_80__989@NODE_1570_length_1463_cov_3_396067_g1216_i0_p1_GENE_NODE_1570_length_1463_cov_3_396067_g1216_i0NODE_1570_length_1463_cov_3_396067_g1216_i0_p1_ORF_typecomplete_len177_score29_39Glycos_transf_1/PF00534_20/1_1e20Glyco_trans_1_4/PF13692_6/6_8e11Glyco_trans_1_2/PF13524_6/6_9e03Glyco_trans_1_2/PF13524_6/0_061IDO/PF01231_18/0_076zfSAP30/PF13866_6/0_33_NODE_1570_length_1463_cov_3_396067_g1216_i085615
MLGILAFGVFMTSHKEDEFQNHKLVICGGYDHSLLENQLSFLQLVEAIDHVKGLNRTNVQLIRSATDRIRLALLRFAAATLYTPSNEHFGIVPIESMSQGTPVVAVNSGGPMESIMDGSTGSLVESRPEDFAKAMELWKTQSTEVSERCQKRAAEFSFRKFSTKVQKSISQLKNSG